MALEVVVGASAMPRKVVVLLRAATVAPMSSTAPPTAPRARRATPKA